MGMLLSHHEGYWPEPEPEDKPKRQRRRATPEAPPAPEVSPYAELTDEQVLEAYATNVPEGEADTREGMQAELEALDAEGNTGE